MNKKVTATLAGLLVLTGGQVFAATGTVTSIETRVTEGKAGAAGTVLGAVIGGVAGHQFGSGRGQDAMTAAGAVGGAMAGREVQKRNSSGTIYDVVIKMDGGDTRRISLASPENLREGDRVDVNGNEIRRI